MYVEGGARWEPPPWHPPQRPPRLTKPQERMILRLVVINAVLLLVAPIGGVTIIQCIVALLTRH